MGHGRAGRPRAAPPLHRRRCQIKCPECGKPMHPRHRGHRLLVRFRLHALRPVALSLRKQGDLREALPGQLHLRGHRPDPRLVLHAAWPSPPCCSTARPLKTASCMGHVQDAEGRKMSKHHGQRGRSVGGAGQAGRGRGPLVFLHRQRSLAAQPLQRRGRQREASASSWARCGTPTRSSCCTPTSTTSTPRITPWTRSGLTLMDKWMLSSRLNSAHPGRGRQT